jgi:hypothetical protein
VAKLKPVFWFGFRDDRHRAWRVYFATPEIVAGFGRNADGIDDHAFVEFTARRIYLNPRAPRGTWETTLLHELGHVALEDTGFEYKEQFIECHAVHQLPILRSVGFRFPSPPRAAFTLRRRKSPRPRS